MKMSEEKKIEIPETLRPDVSSVSVVVEVVACKDGSTSFIIRHVNGQPIKVFTDPEDVATFFRALVTSLSNKPNIEDHE